MLTARTLIEAQVYESVMTAASDAEAVVPPLGPKSGVNVDQGETAWTFHSTVGDIVIDYVSEDASRKLGLPFGLGVSSLLDAAQWAVLAAIYGRRALAADMAYTGQPGQNRTAVELNWEFAAYAVQEALKFVPEGADKVPDEAIWSAMGRQALIDSPELVYRVKLIDDLEYYEGTLSDFRALYGPSLD